MPLRDILAPARIAPALAATSKKRLLESMGELLGRGVAGFDANTAFHCLTERERLGSTGIGDGVALPHGRMKGLDRALGAFAVLDAALDYDTIDRKPINMAFALLVPEHATTEHLQLLAELATVFSNPVLREKLLQTKSTEELYRYLVGEDRP